MSLLRDISADLKKIDQSPKVMRKFGYVLAAVLFIFSMVIWFKHRYEIPAFTVSGLVFLWSGLLIALIASIYPGTLKPLNTGMVVVAMIIGWIMTRVILTVLFYGVFTPIGLILRIIGKDNLNLRLEPDAKTYWIKRPDIPYDPERSTRLF